MGGSALDAEYRFGAFLEPRPQEGMHEVCPGFIKTLDGIAFSHGAIAQPFELGEDEPHPVGLLAATSYFAQGLFIDLILCLDIAVEVMGVIGNAGHLFELPFRLIRLVYTMIATNKHGVKHGNELKSRLGFLTDLAFHKPQPNLGLKKDASS